MRRGIAAALRGFTIFAIVLGFINFAPNTAGAQTGESCVYGDDAFLLGLLDPTNDGVITIADLQEIAAGLAARKSDEDPTGRIDCPGDCPRSDRHSL